MHNLSSVSSPTKRSASIESMADAAPRNVTKGHAGAANEPSRSLEFVAVKGKAGPLRRRAVIESVLGVDERVRILDTELAPWRMICALSMSGPNGAGAIGTGWFVGPKTILTAGHCVHSIDFLGGWAERIEVSPGRNGQKFPYSTVVGTRFTSLDRWVNSADADFDIGCIHLDQPLGQTVGWFALAALGAPETAGYLVNVSGYPGDRGGGTEQYHHRNRVLKVTDRRIYYDVDTYGGQSGAPVWIHESEGTPPLAIGIHAYGTGGSPGGLLANSAPRIIPEVLDQVREWVKADGGWPA